ncbi:hypothetical protein D3C80_1726110 [compost metagenome]
MAKRESAAFGISCLDASVLSSEMVMYEYSIPNELPVLLLRLVLAAAAADDDGTTPLVFVIVVSNGSN